MNKELNIKRIPYGVTDFHKFREANYYYIDKTRFIRKIEEKGRYLFLIRPRRFGKSLFLNILDVYYDITQADQFDYYFQGTNIHQNPTKERNTYLILKLNFSKVDPNPALVEAAFLQTIINTACFFVRKYQKYLDMDIDKAIAQFESQKSPAVVMDMLLTMCQDKTQQLYIIIDEYDNFANIILSEAGETEFQKLTHGSGQLRSFFNVLKAGTTDANAPISRLFITGVSPITLDDVTSGFNIASNISLDADINDIHGFTRPEVEEMIEYYRQTGKILHGTTELMEIMSRWYNHYRFSTRSQQDLYNTFHVLYFLQEYMKYSQIPGILVDENALIDYQKLRQLILIDQQGTNTLNGNFSQLREIMETGILYSDISRSFPVKALMETRNFISLLYYFGLLTITGVDEENKAILKIPNESIRRLYYDYIKSIYEETGTFSIRLHEYQPLMKDMAFNGNWEPMFQYLVKQLESAMGLRELITGEKSIQAFFNVYLGLSPLYLISAERELGLGYADLVLEPFIAQYPALKYAYLLEFKYIKPTGSKKHKPSPQQIQELKKSAEAQLTQYSRDEQFSKSIGKTTLKKLVLIFCGHRMVYAEEV